MEWLSIFLKITLVSGIFYILFKAIYSRFTFFKTNRIILNLILPLTCFLVLFPISTNSHTISTLSSYFTDYQPIFIEKSSFENSRNSAEPSFFSIFQILYFAGVFMALLVFIHQIILIYKIQKSSKKSKAYNLYIYESSSVKSPFSFFKKVYLPINIKENTKEIVLEHEKIHVNEKHSFDIILLQLFKIVLWFNPFCYFLEKSIKANHEYSVDHQIQQKFSLQHYFQALTSISFQSQNISLIHSFKTKTLKNRLTMMTKNSTQNMSKILYSLIIPIIIFCALACSNLAKNNIPSIKPIANVEVSSSFGERLHAVTGDSKMHKGVDFRAEMGTPVFSTADGVISKIDTTSGYGIHIVVRHNEIYETLYSHLSEVKVTINEQVTQGQTIGNVGNTGLSTRPHLHYEVIENGLAIDPEPFLK